MSTSSRLARFAGLTSSLLLLTGYVLYSQHSAQVAAPAEAEKPGRPKARTATGTRDPIAALAACDSRAHQMQPAFTESTKDSLLPPDSVEPLWKSPMNARLMGDRGNGPANSGGMIITESEIMIITESGRMIIPKKLAEKHRQDLEAERHWRMVMPGSKSATVFTPPPDLSGFEPPPVVELLPSELQTRSESLVLPEPSSPMIQQAPSPPPPLPNLLEQSQNIQRILADDGHFFDESPKIVAPAMIAEAMRYEKDAAVCGSRSTAPLPNPVTTLYWPLVRLLMPRSPPLLSPLQNSP